MSFAVLNALAPAPRSAPERAEPPRDEREFARALEDEDADESREAERIDEEKAKGEPATDPAAIPAAWPLAMVQAAVTNNAAIVAPAPAASAPLADAPVEPIPATAPHGEAEAVAENQPEAAPATPDADRVGATLAAASALAGAAGETEPDAAQDQAGPRQADVEADAAPESDAAWTPPGPPKPPGAVTKTPAQSAMTQPAFAQGEELAPVRVLRQPVPEAAAPEAKAAPAQAAASAASPAAPPVASPGASFEAKLQAAEAAAAPSTPQARPAAPPPAAAQVAVHIARTFEEGVRRLEVKLSPAELGRVEVKVDVGQDGRALAVVAADRQDTLDLLQRDARTLERALQDAGIRADSGSLSFTLRQQDRQAWSGSGQDGSRSGHGGGRDSASQADSLVSARPRLNLRALDISV